MKKVFAIILILILALGLVACGTADADSATVSNEQPREMNGDFRYATWGMTMDEIRELEVATLIEEDQDEGRSILGYETTFADHDGVHAVYFFNDDKIFDRAMCVFNEFYSDEFLYIEDYQDIKEVLSVRYGSPTVDDIFWDDETYKTIAQKEDLGSLLLLGHISYLSEWENGNTKIILSLSSNEEHDINTVIYYDAK